MLPKVEPRTNLESCYVVEVFNPGRQKPSRFALTGNAGENTKRTLVKEGRGNNNQDAQEIWEELSAYQS